MNDTVNVEKEEIDIIARTIVWKFNEFTKEVMKRPEPITEQPDAQPMLDALQEAFPGIGREGFFAKLFLSFAGGVNAGIAIAEVINSPAKESK